MANADEIHVANNWLALLSRSRWLGLAVALFTILIAWPWAAWEFQPFEVFLSRPFSRVLLVDGHAGPPVLYRYRNGELRAWDWTTGRDWRLPQPSGWRELAMGADTSKQGTVAFHADGDVVWITTLQPTFAWKEYHLPEHRFQWHLIMISSSPKHAVFLERRDVQSSELVVVDLPAGVIGDRFPLPSFTRIHSSVGEITSEPAFGLTEKRFRLDKEGRWQTATRPPPSRLHGGVPLLEFVSEPHRSFGSKRWWPGVDSLRDDRWPMSGEYREYQENDHFIESPISHSAMFYEGYRAAVWGPNSEMPPVLFRTRDRVVAAGFAADGNHIVVFDNSSNLQVYNTATGQLVAEKTQPFWWFCMTVIAIDLVAAAASIALACREQSMALAGYDAVIAAALVVLATICIDRETVAVAVCGFAAVVGVLMTFVEGDVVSRVARGVGGVIAVTVGGLVPVIATFFIDGYSLNDEEMAHFVTCSFLASLLSLASAWLTAPVYRAAKSFVVDHLSANAAPRKPIQFTIGGLMVLTLIVAALGAAPYWLLEQGSFGQTRLTTVGAIAIGAILAGTISGNGLAFLWLRNWKTPHLRNFAISIASFLIGAYALRGVDAFQGTHYYSVLSETFHHLALPLATASIPLAVARYKGFRWA
jgi:hypothetical protein